MERIQLKFSHNQIGMTIEARQHATASWRVVEIRQHLDHATRAYNWGLPARVMNTSADEREYLNLLNSRGIQYEVIQGEDDYR